MKKSEALSVGRATCVGMNFQVVSDWFSGYEKCLMILALKIIPNTLNTDESGLQNNFVGDKW